MNGAKIVYLPYYEYLEKISGLNESKRYTSGAILPNAMSEIMVHTQYGVVIYRPRPLSKLEKVLR